MPSSGVKQPAAGSGDLNSHLQQSPLAAHGIWAKVVAQRARFVPLSARSNLSLTDPQATWTAKDVSALVSAKAGWILINIVSTTSRWRNFSYRPYGSTADPLGYESFTINGITTFSISVTVLVPLDWTTKKFEYKTDSENTCVYYLIGYVEQAP